MLLNTILSAATTAFVLMAPAATAQPMDTPPQDQLESREVENLDARAFDMRLQWSGNSGCSALGPVREYSRNVCIPLSDNTWAVKIIDHNSRCKMRGYEGGNCGGPSKTAFSSHQCHRLNSVWSVRIEC